MQKNPPCEQPLRVCSHVVFFYFFHVFLSGKRVICHNFNAEITSDSTDADQPNWNGANPRPKQKRKPAIQKFGNQRVSAQISAADSATVVWTYPYIGTDGENTDRKHNNNSALQFCDSISMFPYREKSHRSPCCHHQNHLSGVTRTPIGKHWRYDNPTIILDIMVEP